MLACVCVYVHIYTFTYTYTYTTFLVFDMFEVSEIQGKIFVSGFVRLKKS